MLWPESLEGLCELADDLRTIWRIDHTSAVAITVSTGSLSPEEDILNKWLMWRPTGAEEEADRAARMRFHARALNKVTSGQPPSQFLASDPGGVKAGFMRAHENDDCPRFDLGSCVQAYEEKDSSKGYTFHVATVANETTVSIYSGEESTAQMYI